MTGTNLQEQARLETLRSYDILNTPPEAHYDRLTRLAARICEAPIAIVTLVDENRLCFKSVYGIPANELEHEFASCAHPALSPSPLIVADAAEDPRLAGSPIVIGPHKVRFYAGVPLISPGGHVLGTLAVMDRTPRTLNDTQLEALQTLADQVIVQLELRRLQGGFQPPPDRIHTRRKLSRSTRVAQTVRTVTAAVTARSGHEFLEQLALNIAQALGAQAAFVARLLPGQPGTARMIASAVDGHIIENFDYAVEGTPCAGLRQSDQFVVEERLGELFPGSPSANLGGHSYVGRRLLGSAGQHLGQLFVVFRQPLKQSDVVTTTLRVFAGRAAVELERQQSDAYVRERAALLDQARDAIVVTGMDDRIVYWNEGAERLYGWSAAEVIGRAHVKLLDDDPATSRDATDKLLRAGELRSEVTQRSRDGKLLTVERHWTLVKDEHGEPQSILSISTDVTQRRAAERQIQYLAFYDPLTRLPNRQLLLDRLRHVLASSGRTRHAGALLFIDLDNFKTLNDTLGHDVGDQLLQQVAIRLSACVRESDTVARLGGDEFIVMLDYLSEDLDYAGGQARTVGEKILSALNEPFQLAGYEHHSTPSIGVTLFMNQQDTVDELLKRADLAMYQAKASGRNTMCFFDPEMQIALTARATLANDMRRALRRDEFCLHFQPQVDADGRVLGAEALLRWNHPHLGVLTPANFISLAEETGLILPLGYRVLELACAQSATWATRPEMAGLRLSVNISAHQFRRPDFVDQLLRLLEHTGVDPRQLKMELTERLLAGDVEDKIVKMTALKAHGVAFSLDDFGTGYSSLSWLKRLPLDELKIDQSFVMDVVADPDNAVVVGAIVALGDSLGLSVIAEGVETEAQREILARHGCRAYQGNLFSRPLPPNEFEAFMERHRLAQRSSARSV